MEILEGKQNCHTEKLQTPFRPEHCVNFVHTKQNECVIEL